MNQRLAGRGVAVDRDDAAARLVARGRVLVVTAVVLGAALAFGDNEHANFQYVCAFGVVPLAVALAFVVERLPVWVASSAGAVIDLLLVASAIFSFPGATGSLAGGLLIPVVVASYTGGRLLGAVSAGAAVATLVVADISNRADVPSGLVALIVVALVVCLAVVGRADSQRVVSAARVRHYQSRAAAVLERVAEPIIVTDGTCHVVDLNPAAAALLGGDSAMYQHKPCAAAMALHVNGAALDCRDQCALLAVAGSSTAGGIEATHDRPGAAPVPLLVSVATVPDGLGGVQEYIHTLRDISKLKMADEAKTLFLATASHELKTPITVIRGFLDTIDREGVSDELRASAMRVMKQRAGELGTIVERLLLASRIESGRLDLDVTPTPVVGIAADRVHAIHVATNRDVRLEAPGDGDGNGDGAVPLALANSSALATVIDHLVDNACKYSQGFAPVIVRITSDDAHVVLDVVDQGAGMTPAEVAHCFERFWQADPSSTRRVGGTGIGLYIVKSLVESMGATITVESVPHRGTTFSVLLRRADTGDVQVDLLAGAAADTDAGVGAGGGANGAATTKPEPSIVREFMRQIGVPSRGGKA